MNTDEISFDNLPKAIAHLVDEVEKLKLLIEKSQTPITPKRRIPVGIDEASHIIGKAKQTIYSMVQKRQIPCYKNGKKLYFFEDELLKWITKGKKKTMIEIENEAKIEFRKRSKGIRR
ncbi:helix-turn-helix domain-containing protein [Labilibaculum sp.]|uniref:helix-turn-helix domain-containing protein n=1 Tax=Labilibaculum sp. TaxID=2060723 RepID=UPI003562B076